MKHQILGIIILFLLASCQGPKSEKQEKAIDEGIDTEFSTALKNDTIFLGLRFGMGGEEVHNYFQELVSQGKLHLIPHEYLSDKGKIYIYKFDFEDKALSLQNVQASFRSYYMQDKLFKLRISVDSEKESNLQMLKSKLIEDYILKYGQNYTEQEYTLNNSEGCVWTDGDKMIEIFEGFNNNVLITYTDLQAVKENKEVPRQTIMREI